MDDYISREAAIIEVYRFDDYLDDDLEWRLHYALKKLPAADVAEVRHGRWKPVGSITPMYECDQCHTITLGGKFCSNCGAKMDGGPDK